MDLNLAGNEQAAAMAEAYLAGKKKAPLIISGPKGLGQERLAEWIAKSILGTDDLESCSNFYGLSSQSGSIRTEAVEEMLSRSFLFAPNRREKAFMVYDIGVMTKQGQNRLLKLLEDRNDSNIVLMTETGGNLLDTIKSRSVTIKMNRVSDEDMRSYLSGNGIRDEQDACIAAFRGCPYLLEGAEDRIGNLYRVFQGQKEVRDTKGLLSLFHELREKDSRSFYEQNKDMLGMFLDMETSIFEGLLMDRVHMGQEKNSGIWPLYQKYDVRQVIAILEELGKQKDKWKSTGMYTRNDFFSLVDLLCGEKGGNYDIQ